MEITSMRKPSIGNYVKSNKLDDTTKALRITIPTLMKLLVISMVANKSLGNFKMRKYN